MANTRGEKELKTDWPVEEGLTARTQTQTGRTMNLIPDSSVVEEKETIGFT